MRDFYHEHIYAASGDFALRPVLADDERDAVRKILHQYQAKIIDYHSEIKNCLSLFESSTIVPSSRSLLDLMEDICSARGEMIYAMSFARLFDLPEDCLMSVERAYRSFTVLKDRTEPILSIASMALNQKVLILTLVLTFSAAYSLLRGETFGSICAAVIALAITWAVSLPLWFWLVRAWSRRPDRM